MPDQDLAYLVEEFGENFTVEGMLDP